MKATGSLSRIHFSPLFFCALLLSALFSRESLFAQSRAPDAPRVPERVRESVERRGSARVIVELALAGAAHTLEGELHSVLAVANQRRQIAGAQGRLVSRLRNTSHEIKRDYETLPFLALEVGPDALAALEKDPEVLGVFEDRLSRPVLDGTAPLVQASQAWSSGFDGTGTVVAILDTGVDKTHSFFGSRVVEEACYSSGPNGSSGSTGTCPNGLKSQTGSGSAAPCTYAPQDCNHGTHVAGIAAGFGPTLSGIAPGARIMSIQVFSRFDNPVCSNLGIPYSPCALSWDSDQIKALERVYQLRTTYNFAAANLSLGGGFSTAACDTQPIKPAIDNLRAVGIATAIAAGNNGLAGGTSFPGCVSSAVSVGAVDDSNLIAGFSNNASFLSLLAPGVAVNSSIPGGGFASFNGTSMATPHVAGAFAVMKQALPSATVNDILALLKGTGLFITDARQADNVITKPRIALCSALARLSTIQFSAAAYSVSEGAGNAQISATRSGGCLFNSASVDFQTSPGTATPGIDYTSTSGTLSFGSGVTTQSFQIAITNDTTPESPETINLSLLPPSSGTVNRFNGQYSGGYSGTSSVSGAVSGDIAFNVTNGAVQIFDPGTGTGSVAGSGAFSATGTGGLTDGSCTYSGTLMLAADGTPQGSGTYACTFTGGSSSGSWSGAHLRQRLGSPVASVLTINDNDPPAVQFVQAEYTIVKTARHAKITVRRNGLPTGTLTLNYSTTNGTAVAGQHYMPAAGTLTFSKKQASATFMVPLRNDGQAGPDRTVHLTLSNPSGDGTLGAQHTAVLKILNGSPGGSLQADKQAAPAPASSVSVIDPATMRHGRLAAPIVYYYGNVPRTAIDWNSAPPAGGVIFELEEYRGETGAGPPSESGEPVQQEAAKPADDGAGGDSAGSQ